MLMPWMPLFMLPGFFQCCILIEEWGALWLWRAGSSGSQQKAERRVWLWSVGKAHDKHEKHKRFECLALAWAWSRVILCEDHDLGS